MRETSRKVVYAALNMAGLFGPYFRWRERRSAVLDQEAFDDGLPMPPPERIIAVSGGAGARRWFSEQGADDAKRFRAFAERYGAPVAAAPNVLDFGCGVGRIARWIAPAVIEAGGRFSGCDIDSKAIAWCARNLQGTYFRSALQPPLRLGDASMDLIYAKSVVTHLREDTARAWLTEIRRLLRPDGCAIVTFHDETYAAHWAPQPVRGMLDREPYVIWNDALEGSNYMSAWTTRGYFERLASDHFTVAEMVPAQTDFPQQAIAVLKPR